MGKMLHNLLRGAATLMELFPARPRAIELGVVISDDDGAAITSDWMAVGDDLRSAMTTNHVGNGMPNDQSPQGRE